MKVHWKILAWLIAGVIVGGGFQAFLSGSAISGLVVADSANEGAAVMKAGPKSKAKAGDVISAIIKNRGRSNEQRIVISDAKIYRETIASSKNGDIVWHELGESRIVPVNLSLDPNSQRAAWIKPFAFLADMFIRLLKLLIVPIILTSIIVGVIGVGNGANLRRLGFKTFAYYISTSMLAIFTGLALVNLIRPGEGAALGLAADDSFSNVTETSFADVLLRMIPENVFAAFGANLNMLQVIFFALLFGYFVLKTAKKHREVMSDFFESAFEVMMKMAAGILSLIPYGVFCLLVKVVGSTGYEVFKPLGVYMITVTSALLIHCLITLPLILKFVAKISPIRWAKAVSPALLTAFSTSSSSMTLPVSLETVEDRGKVSNRVVSFVQPLGATINMDGTALYECIGVIFLAQYYQGVSGYELTFGAQIMIVFMALMASIGAAGIPSAGLIMMVTILSALKLPVEGAALLLAVDRPLDMLRTVTNVFSDTCGSAVVAISEGETGPREAGA
ncbi:MAG: dicarboxylate/amino acid:cation symporter [Planctomycetota bacterium]